MDFFRLLEAIVATIVIFLALSLIASELLEQLQSLTRARAFNLEKTIENLLGQAFKEKVYKDLKQELGVKLYKSNSDKSSNLLCRSLGPSYIEASDFSRIVISLLKDDGQNPDISSSELFEKIKKGDLLKSDDQTPTEKNFEDARRIFKSIATMAEFSPSSDNANDKMQKFRAELEKTFNSAQERTTGHYKRWSKLYLFILGLFIAAIANADALYIVTEFAKKPAITAPLIEAATDESLQSEELQPLFSERLTEALQVDDLPLFWRAVEDNTPWWDLQARLHDKQKDNLIGLGIGWIISAVAIMMGAPFWFDLLKNVVNVRSTLRPLDRVSGSRERVRRD